MSSRDDLSVNRTLTSGKRSKDVDSLLPLPNGKSLETLSLVGKENL